MKIALKLENGYLQPNSKTDIEKLAKLKNGIYEVDLKNMDTRTAQQNKAYHLWATHIAHELNNCGATIPKIIKIQTLWDAITVKELIFKKVLKAVYNKTSSTQLNRDEYDLFIDTITEAFATKGIVIPAFPAYEKEEK